MEAQIGNQRKGKHPRDGAALGQMPRYVVDMTARAAFLTGRGGRSICNPGRRPDSDLHGAAVGMPVRKDGIFDRKQSDAVACADEGIGGGGPMVDHRQLNLLGG